MVMIPDNFDIHSPQRYGEQGYPWEEWDQLRRDQPVFWYERDDVEPFWAVTRHEDIMTISGQPKIFINGGPRLRLAQKGEPELLRGGLDEFGKSRGWDPQEPPDVSFMDDPRHRHVRRASSWAFTQGGMRRLAEHFDALAAGFTEQFMSMLERDGEADFVRDLACKLPLAAVGELMELPPDDWKQLLIWSNAILGEVHPSLIEQGETEHQAAERIVNVFRTYLEDLIHEHRVEGGGPSGFVNRLVQHEVQGQPLNDQQLIGYLFVLIGAGNDTTRNATAGALEVLLDNPDQVALLEQRPDLLSGAVDEVLRWTSPVIHFLRTATESVKLNGKTIREGDTVCMFYPSGNRDEAVFENPYQFDVARTENPYLSLGFGAHFCLGANLAKAELRSMLKVMLPILPRLEIAGPGTRIANTHVSGYSTLPVRLKH